MKEHLRDIMPYQPGKPIDELKREMGLKEVVKLASNEIPFPPSPAVKRAITDVMDNINRYPEGGCFYLRQRISREFSIDESQIIFGNGSDEIIIMAMRALVGRDEEVITAVPTFLVYRIAAMVEGVKLTEIPMRDFRYDLKAIKAAITPQTRLIFIVNPNNPTGTYVSKDEVVDFLRGLPEHIVVFFDEAYFEFAREADYPNCMKYVADKRNVIVARTFSKYYGLAGLRIGYAFADKGLIDLLNKVREPFNVNSMAQAAAIAALDSREYYERCYREIVEAKAYLEKALDDMEFPYIHSVTNFILVKIGKSAQVLCDELLKRGIIVRDMKAWGIDEYVRITVGRMSEVKKLVKELKQFLKG